MSANNTPRIVDSCGCDCCGDESNTPGLDALPRWARWVTPARFVLGALAYAAALLLPLVSRPLAPALAPVRITLFIAAWLLIGGDVLWRAVRNLARGKVFDENFLMTIATLGALAIGEHAEAVGVMVFYQIGEYFQDRALDRSRDSIAELLDIRAEYANLITSSSSGGSSGGGGGEETPDPASAETTKVDPEQLNIGQLILIKHGEKVPVDGVVVAGTSALDTAALTGEAAPVPVTTGDPVLSGSINLREWLTVRVACAYEQSTVSKITQLVEDAAANKAPQEAFITRFARYYTPAVVAAAVALAVLPPLVLGGLGGGGIGGGIGSGIGGGIGSGIGGGIGGIGAGGSAALWHTWLSRALVFLVVSCPCALVISIPLSYFGGIGGASRNGILVKGGNYLAALARTSVVAFDKTGTLTTCAYGGADNREHVNETVKPDARQAIADLRGERVHTLVMLSGDARSVADDVAVELGLDAAYSELLPQDKVATFEKLQHEHAGQVVAFVGDGVNDAPVLARADVGIAMGGIGSDAAVEAADIVLMTDEPSKVAQAIRIAKKTQSIVWQNIAFALGVKAVILVLAALGISTMWEAVFGDVGVALLATLNATRAMRLS